MNLQTKPYLTAEEYLALERSSELRSEYLDGEMVAMAGGSAEHSLIIGNLVGELRQQLKGRPCRVHPSDLRVLTPTGLHTYPDVVVVCGESRFEDERRDTLLNPTAIIEVLSSSTESYDRGKKFEHYRTLQSLREYLLVSQDRLRVEQFVRQDGNVWLFKDIAGPDQGVALPSIECEIALSEIYDKVTFP